MIIIMCKQGALTLVLPHLPKIKHFPTARPVKTGADKIQAAIRIQARCDLFCFFFFTVSTNAIDSLNGEAIAS